MVVEPVYAINASLGGAPLIASSSRLGIY